MIRHIRIQNFKSIRDVTVDLSPVTVLVGPSGVGKTSFLSAIAFLRDYLRDPSADHRARYGERLQHVNAPASPICFDIEFQIPTYDESFHYELTINKSGLASEALRLGCETLYEQYRDGDDRPWEWHFEPHVSPLPNTGPGVLGRLPGMPHAVIAFAALTEGIGAYRFHSSVLTSPEANGRGLGDTGTGYLNVLRDLASNWQQIPVRKQIVAALQHLNPSVQSIELDSIQQPTAAIVGHRVGDTIITLGLTEQSDGFRRFYAHLLALYQTPPKQLLMFEEPENGIHPGALALLAEEFQAAAEQGRGQVLLTTQSPGLLNHFTDEQIRVVELVDLETKIAPLANEQRECLKERLLKPGDLLTVDLARREVAAS